MKKQIIIIFIIILIFIILGFTFLKPNSINYRLIAEEWIKNESPTYLYDGYDLSFISEEYLGNNTYKYTFIFKSKAAGYGDRSDEIVAQVITPHIIEIIIKNGLVIDAITDNVFSEIESRFIKEIVEKEVTLPEFITVFVYFGSENEELVAVKREIPATLSVARATIKELIRGPSDLEIEKGYYSSINSKTKIQKLEIRNGTAYVDFSEELEFNVAGSATVNFIKNQIKQTLFQFETVGNIVISINGRTEDILQP